MSSKIDNLNVKGALACFKDEAGNHFDKLVADISSNVGRLDKDIVSKSSGWTVGTKGKIVSKEGHTLQLPLNSGWSTLLRFGMQLLAISQAGSTDKHDMYIQAYVPAEAKSWFDEWCRQASIARNEAITKAKAEADAEDSKQTKELSLSRDSAETPKT